MSSQEEQLIELLLTLKKTTPEQARAILSSTPQIAYALITLMVKMNAIDVQVLQKTLTSYSANMPPSSGTPSTSQIPGQAAASSSMPPSTAGGAGAGGIQAASAIPPHLSQYRTPTPQTQVHTPPLYNGHGHTPQPLPPAAPGGYMTQIQNQSPYAAPSTSGYGTSAGSTGAGAGTSASMGMLPDALAAIPDEQKAMIMRVISMTPEQINMLPPTERASIIQLRTTLGLPL